MIKRPYIIAEIGSNWKRKPFDEGMALAFRNIDDAAMAGVSAVKFQLFTHEELYGMPATSPEQDKYALPRKWLTVLDNYCRLRGVDFLCSVFSIDGLNYLDNWINPKLHKIASSEACDIKLLEATDKIGKPILISTGGLQGNEMDKIKLAFPKAELIFMACSAKYPAKISDYALQSIGTSCHGLSDHTRTNTLAIASAARGCYVFEKHFDALKEMKGVEPSPDTEVSIGPKQLRSYVKAIRRTYQAYRETKHGASDDDMRTKWRRRLKVCKFINSATDKLHYGINYGAFRSIAEDTRAATPFEWERFEGKLVKRDMKPQEGLWFDDIY